MDRLEQPCWPAGRRCAVSITFDDALPVHHELAGPALEALGMRGTFYLHITAAPCSDPMPWQALAVRGHELGNHSLFHPCRRKAAHRAWLDKAFDLRRYEPIRFQKEVRVANAFLKLIDGLVSAPTPTRVTIRISAGGPTKQPFPTLSSLILSPRAADGPTNRWLYPA